MGHVCSLVEIWLRNVKMQVECGGRIDSIYIIIVQIEFCLVRLA